MTKLITVFLMLLIFPIAALAQGTTVDPTTPPDVGSILQQLFNVIGNWKTGGLIVGILGITNVLTNVIKIDKIKTMLGVKPWMLPLVSMLLGSITAFTTALIAHASLSGALITALIAGLGGIGIHEIANVFNADKQAARAAGNTVLAHVQTADETARSEKLALHKELDAIGKLDDNKAKTAALAEWAQEHAPEPATAAAATKA